MQHNGKTGPLFNILFVDNVGFIETSLRTSAWVIVDLGNNRWTCCDCLIDNG
jgi:hypothetical protein